MHWITLVAGEIIIDTHKNLRSKECDGIVDKLENRWGKEGALFYELVN